MDISTILKGLSTKGSTILINYDFKDGNELPYKQGCECKGSFTTNCLQFFSFDKIRYDGFYDVIMVNSNGDYISAKELLENHGQPYTDKAIRHAHNIMRIFVAGGFEWFKIDESMRNIWTMGAIHMLAYARSGGSENESV